MGWHLLSPRGAHQQGAGTHAGVLGPPRCVGHLLFPCSVLLVHALCVMPLGTGSQSVLGEGYVRVKPCTEGSQGCGLSYYSMAFPGFRQQARQAPQHLGARNRSCSQIWVTSSCLWKPQEGDMVAQWGSPHLPSTPAPPCLGGPQGGNLRVASRSFRQAHSSVAAGTGSGHHCLTCCQQEESPALEASAATEAKVRGHRATRWRVWVACCVHPALGSEEGAGPGPHGLSLGLFGVLIFTL